MSWDGLAEEVAPRLLGAVLRSGPVSVRVTEVEAYGGADDPGSHAFRGRTRRNEVMFGPAGRAYVYFTYGMHWCLNVVTGLEGEAAAVLLRAGEVIEGLELVRERRPGARDRDLARGPARLTRALALDGSCNGVDLVDPHAPVQLLAATVPAAGDAIRSGPRVGVAGRGAATPWRFWLDGDPTVSAYRPAVSRRRPAVPVRPAS